MNDRAARRAVSVYLMTVGVVIWLMMVFGVLMRLTQGGWLGIGPVLFYELMTAHGVGMVGAVAIGGAAIMWHFLRRYVGLSTGVFVANLVLFLLGVALILGAIFVGHFATGWTFLYPLPFFAMGQWPPVAAALFFMGMLAIGSGFLLFYLDAARAIIARYGSLAGGLGWPRLFGSAQGEFPPPAVVASTMVLIVNTIGTVTGAVFLVIALIQVFQPSMKPDPLVAKNMIYFFGHVFINATIYMTVIAVYEILPRVTGRPWKSNRAFLASWTASTVLVLTVYPHHLLMDFAMPTWALVLGQVLSYMNGLPVLVVTAYGAVTIVHRSGIRWGVVSSLIMLSTFGWAAGVVPAIVDSTIVINHVFHNTLWVPGHFHFYLLLGVVPMILGFMLDFAQRGPSDRISALEKTGFWLYLVGGLLFVGVFLDEGRLGVPRRYAVHLPQWMPYDRFGAVAAIAVLLASAVLLGIFIGRVRQSGDAA